MAVETLEMKSAVPVAAVSRSVFQLARSPLRIPAWSVVAVVIFAGIYGYVAGRQNPVHHYVPYVGYPLVLDTTTGKSCYSTAPKPADDTSAGYSAAPGDGSGIRTDVDLATGPAIPMCGKNQ